MVLAVESREVTGSASFVVGDDLVGYRVYYVFIIESWAAAHAVNPLRTFPNMLKQVLACRSIGRRKGGGGLPGKSYGPSPTTRIACDHLGRRVLFTRSLC